MLEEPSATVKTDRLVLRELSCVSSKHTELNSRSDWVQTGRREGSNTFFLSWDQFSVSLWADKWAHIKTQHSALSYKLHIILNTMAEYIFLMYCAMAM